MKTKLLRPKSRIYFIAFFSLLLLGAIPYFAGSGLDRAESLGSYLNANFPANLSEGLPYVPVFPNITFDSPLTFNEVPNTNKIIIGQRDGKIFWFDKIPNVSTKNVMLDLSHKVGVVWDGGFLGLALHPKFGTPGNNYFYTWYTTEDSNSNDFPNMYTTQSCNSEEYWGNFLVLARYTADPNTLSVQESSEQILLKIRMYGTTHRGGGLVFGDDGFLYLTTGDQTAFKKAQDITNNLDGGVLRLDVDKDNTKSHPPVRTMPDDHGFSDEISGNGYWIPNDNPFLSATGANFEEYYSLGHRNPHRMTKDRATGALYVGEIGGSRHEEINVVKKGKNYGWPLYEGLFQSTFCVPALLNGMTHEAPLTVFPRAEANAVIGGYVYRGSEIPELEGKYICADYGNGEEIWSIDVNTGSYSQLGNFSSTNIISFGEDQDAELYIMKQGISTLYKMVSRNNPVSTMPNFLSQTGAFENLNTLEPADGLIPYDLVESFWSDGALKKRWIGIPNNGTHDTAAEKIDYSENDVWNFPVGSVLVKHFELPIDERNPSITKRLETRFSVKAANGNFYFTTYKWNEEQTDAEVLASGLDETINIIKADGSVGTQTWRYPSNIECITCHNPSSGGTLGTRTRYLNKDYTYPKTGRTANQLVTLSHLGILNEVINDTDTGALLTSKSIDDPNASVEEKARSYMDLNCAYCHRPGTGNRADFDLRLQLNLTQTRLLTAATYEPLGITDEKIVSPGNPDASILYHRLNSTDPTIMMPPIAKNKVDTEAVALIDEWIRQLTPIGPTDCADRIIMETFSNIPGPTIAELKNNASFPNNPSQINELNEFSIPVNTAENYGVRVQGQLIAPETGIYYFWISGDDNVELNLSNDDNDSNKIRIAYHDSWSSPSEWNKFATQKSAGINLVEGQRYYIEALMNEATGGDNLSVGWRTPSNGNGSVPVEIIPCSEFDTFSTPSMITVTGVALDLTTLALEVGDTATLTATVSPSDASDKSVTWSSSDSAIATVDANGLVTAIAEGDATIMVETVDGGFVAQAAIGVTDPNRCPDRIIIEIYENVPGFSIAELKNNVNFPDSPSSTDTLEKLTIPYNAGDNYGVRVKGLLKAPETGTYYFWITGDDNVELSLSTNSSSVNKVMIAYHDKWSSWNEWNKYPTQKSVGINLIAGQNYYIEALMNERSGGDNLSVGWRKPSDGNGTDPARVIPCSMFDTFSTPPLVNVTGIAISPSALSMTMGEGTTLTSSISPSNATNKSLLWSSSDISVASVNTNGLVTAISEGNAFITATTVDGGFESQSEVVVTSGNNPDVCFNGIIIETYAGVQGFSIPELKNNVNFPNFPSSIDVLDKFVIPYNTGDYYGVRVKGLLKAPETGTYYFWITGDDNVELNLSTNAGSSNKTRISYHERWSSWNEWNKYPTQKSVGIDLVAGQNYYIEALMNERSGGDYLAVGWRRPSDGDGANPAELIPCEVFDTFSSSQSLLTDLANVTVDVNLQDFTLTPNPATTEVWIALNDLEVGSEVTYSIYAVSGKKVLFLKGGREEIIDIRGFAKGMYFIVVQSGEWSSSKKLIVK